MLKKFLISFIAIAASLAISASANAADVYQTIDVTSNGYPNINFYPRTLHVCQGDTLHLTVRNTRTGYTRIFMPAFNLDQDIAPQDVARFDFCVANPIGKNMWFEISSIDAKKVPGTLVTNNYQIPVVSTTPRIIDVSVLNDIINYNKEFCYSEKAEPQYRTSKPCPTGGAVRGCW